MPNTVPAMLLGASRALSQLGLALATIVIAREVGVDGLGRYTFFTAAGSVGVASVASGLAVAGTRDSARGMPWSRSTVVRLAPLLLPGAVAAMAATLVVQGPDAWRPAAVAVAVFALAGWLAISSALACGLGNYTRAAAGEALAGTTLPIFTVVAIGTGQGLTGALVAVGAASLLGTLVMGPVLRGDDTGALHRTPRSSVPFVLIGVASTGYARLDALVVGIAGGDTDLGLYSAAYRLLGPVLILASAFGSVFFAELSRGSSTIDLQTLRRGSAALSAMLIPIALIEAVAAGWIIDTLYGPGFEDAVLASRILLLAAIPLAAYWPVAHALNAAGHERTWASALGVAALGSAALAGWWVIQWGVVGAAAAWVVTEISLAAFLLTRGRRLLTQ